MAQPSVLYFALVAAINTRLMEAGHVSTPSLVHALTADVETVINANSGTAIANSAADVASGWIAPAHGWRA